MKYIQNITEVKIEEPTVISLGKFDGIHRGHELLMEQLFKKKESGLKTAVFTFDIPPKKSVEQTQVKVLTTNKEKLTIFGNMGVDYLIECPFTKEVMCMEPEAFIEMLVKQFSVTCIVAGEDFRFGHKRRGDYRMLQEYATVFGYEAIIVKKIQEDERDISSTFVRECIVEGDIEKANHLLGYRYFVTGEVLHGNKIGRTIGIPTINLLPTEEKLLPPCGVYVTEVYIGDKRYDGVTNVGRKPTIEGTYPIGVETHLLDFNSDVYGKEATVEFLHHVRGEQKFESVEALQAQMMNDIAFARTFLQKK